MVTEILFNDSHCELWLEETKTNSFFLSDRSSNPYLANKTFEYLEIRQIYDVRENLRLCMKDTFLLLDLHGTAYKASSNKGWKASISHSSKVSHSVSKFSTRWLSKWSRNLRCWMKICNQTGMPINLSSTTNLNLIFNIYLVHP